MEVHLSPDVQAKLSRIATARVEAMRKYWQEKLWSALWIATNGFSAKLVAGGGRWKDGGLSLRVCDVHS